ncbi:MAG TPA: DUF3488 and transglutaminase-like domain-containing protein [Rariglobus sp.]|nr:DUF3488 and transglutaminase-like domain-containing protein [Rariglobus sp.]
MLAVISAWTVLYMDVEAWALLALVTLAVPVVTVRPDWVARVPRWIDRLAFPVLVGIFALDMTTHLKEPIAPIIRLALMLVLYRVITPRKRRDDLQLILLGLFLVVVGGVLSVSIVFAAQIVVFTAVALIFLLVITLVDAMEQGLPVVAAADGPPAWMYAGWGRLGRRLRECLDWRVAALSVLLFGGVVGLSAVLFMAIPRFDLGNSLFLDGMMSRKAKTGFSENIQFGDVVDIQQDTGVALSVDVSDRSKVPAELYWRMLVLDEYKNHSFGMSPVLKRSLDDISQRTSQVQGDARLRADMPVWTFYLETGTSRFLPLLGAFYQITFDGQQDAAFSHELNLVALRRTPAKMLAYRVEGMPIGPSLRLPVEGGAVQVSKEDDPQRPVFTGLDLKENEKARLAAWVTAINAPPENPADFARRACAWLQKAHTYSLQSQIRPGEEDPLVFWIGSKEAGHCELFAGAFTLLAREAGYPARVVLGFKGGSWNATSESLTVRNSDAHAWCEIFDRASNSWLRVDPTPGSVAVGDPDNAPQGEAALARIRDHSWDARFEGLRIFWYRRIVNFDQTSQFELAHKAKKLVDGRLKSLKQALRHRLAEFKAWIQSPWDMHRVAVWIAGVLALAGLGAAWRLRGRGEWLRWRSGRAHGRKMDPVRREAGRWLRKISDSGFGSADLVAVRAELEDLRYGPQTRRSEPLAVFRRAKRALRAGTRLP